MSTLKNPLKDKYLFNYITSFLKICKKCNNYDYINYINVCCICKDFYCEKCNSTEMKYHGYYDETNHKYCNSCGKKYFSYYYK
jgi:hypothetical protein